MGQIPGCWGHGAWWLHGLRRRKGKSSWCGSLRVGSPVLEGGGPAGSLRYVIWWQTSGLQGCPAPQDAVGYSHRGIKVVTSRPQGKEIVLDLPGGPQVSGL